MLGGQDRLQKELDTLTYNARSVLNALIRSTIKGGSSNGYTITRSNESFTLSRVAIYRLYKFYQEWESKGFDVDKFDTIRLAQDKIPVRDVSGNETYEATTDAIVTHSKILYYVNTDKSNLNVNEFWLVKVKNASNPKLVTNMAPIPLNLRTPVFDENMATTTYNQHETYLFPASYYSSDIKGYSGDGISHVLDGGSWDINSDTHISIKTHAFSSGDVNNSDSRKTKSRRNGEVLSNGSLAEYTYSTAMGFATQARAKYSTTSGYSSIVPRYSTGAVAIGMSLLASDAYAVSIGGITNCAVNIASGVVGGINNKAVGKYSGILAGINNSTGGATDAFTFPIDEVSSSCITVVVDSECDSSINTSVTTGSALGRNQIAISGNAVGRYFIDDTLALFAFTTFKNASKNIKYYELHGDSYNTQYLSITSVEYIDPAKYPNNSNRGKTIITLTSDVIGYGIVDGGVISRIKNYKGVELGYASVALNNNTIASGNSQTVVGRYNYVNEDTLFVVGNGNYVDVSSGSNYVINGRSNVFEVYANGASIFGTIHNKDNPTSYVSVEMAVNSGGIESYAYDSSMMVTQSYAHLRVGNYIGLFAYNGNEYDIELSAYNNPLLIKNGDYVDVNYVGLYENDIGIISSTRTKLISNYCIIARSETDYVQIDAPKSDIVLTWGSSLRLDGETFGTLPTNKYQQAHCIRNKTKMNQVSFANNGGSTSSIFNAGFYDIQDVSLLDSNVFTTNTVKSSITSAQMISITGSDYIGSSDEIGGYHSTKLYFPYKQLSKSKVPSNPILTIDEFDNTGALKISTLASPKSLAFLDDVGYRVNVKFSDLFNDKIYYVYVPQGGVTVDSVSGYINKLNPNTNGDEHYVYAYISSTRVILYISIDLDPLFDSLASSTIQTASALYIPVNKSGFNNLNININNLSFGGPGAINTITDDYVADVSGKGYALSSRITTHKIQNTIGTYLRISDSKYSPYTPTSVTPTNTQIKGMFTTQTDARKRACFELTFHI